jgi:hypothetical protein
MFKGCFLSFDGDNFGKKYARNIEKHEELLNYIFKYQFCLNIWKILKI